MRICVITGKRCWDENGTWMSSGGFPLQMKAIGTLFDEMTLVVSRGPRQRGGTALPQPARVVPIDPPPGAGLGRKLSLLGRLPFYYRLMREECRRADVIHAPLPGDLSLVGMLTALLLGKKLIGRYGGSWIPNGETTMMNRVTRWLMSRSAGGRNVMLATGEGTDRPAKGMHWLFATALQQQDLERTLRARKSEEAGEPMRIAYVGRFSPEKGLNYLIEGFAMHVRKQSRSARLTLIGTGPMEGSLRELAREKGLNGEVSFAGQMSHADVLNALLDMDLCVLPSLTESFCKARLDAMACGVPVITTEAGFGREIVGSEGERGWIVRTADSEDIARQLERAIMATPVWKDLRGRCREFVRGRTLEAWAERIGQICADQWGMRLENGVLR